jgi:predicted transport protein
LVENPKLLGLGDLVVKDKERSQLTGGRLDLLLQDPDTARRYEVEIQLGRTDETHIVRTIEYWDVERKRYPQYDHCAVIVAEEITGRFLNVISLFNGFIPIIALRMQAIAVGDSIGLIFTKVLDEVQLGLVDEDEEVQEPTDRGYWEEKASSKTVKLADRLVELIQEFAPGHELKYNKHYIGLAVNGRPNNFVAFRPQRTALRLEVKLPKSDEVSRRLEEVGLEVLEYDRQFGYYKLRLSAEDIEKHREFLVGLMKEAFDART